MNVFLVIMNFIFLANLPNAQKLIKFIHKPKTLPSIGLKNYKPCKGSILLTLIMTILTAVVKDKDANANKRLYEFLKYILISDEVLSQTFILNRLQDQKTRIQNKNVTYVHWNNTTGRPVTLIEEHFKELKDNDRFFARKFDHNKSGILLNKIDRELLSLP